MPLRNVAVFCASAQGRNPRFSDAAAEVGRELAARSLGLIYGGSRIGLMNTVAESCLAAGGRVVGVIPEVLVDLEVAHHGLSELHVVSTMHQRKAMMSDRADAFLVLPGGLGTLEELFEVLAWQTLRLHSKPIVLLNLDGFFDDLLRFLDHATAEGLIRPESRAALLVATDVVQAFAVLATARE